MAEAIDAGIITTITNETTTSVATATITYTDNDGGFLVTEELRQEIVTANTTAGVTWTGTGITWKQGYDAKAEARADALLKECFPELREQFKDNGHCEFDSTLYPIRYTLTPSRVYVSYKEKQIGFVCVSANYFMPPSDRILQMLLHFRQDEAYVLRVGNWNANIGHSALEYLKKAFSKKKGGKMVYHHPKRSKRNWWAADWLDWQWVD